MENALRALIALTLFAVLAACGVDGAPEKPEPKPAVTVTGSARAGVQTKL